VISMRKLEFVGTVRTNTDHFSKTMTLPGRDDLLVVPSDWPMELVPGTLNVEIHDFPEGFDEIGEGDGLEKLDKSEFRAALIIPQRKIVGNTLNSTSEEPTKGFAQVWRAELQVVDTGQATKCWMMRRIGSDNARQLELVSDEHLCRRLNLVDGMKVRVTVYEAESNWKPPTPAEIIEDWCEAARGVEEDWGSEKAVGYLIGEKFLNFLEVAETKQDWRDAIPTFVSEIKAIFEPWQLADFLTTPRRLGPLGHTADDEGHRMLRASLTEDEKVREDTRNLLLLEWAKELLLEDGES
jgi:hypothetical protein